MIILRHILIAAAIVFGISPLKGQMVTSQRIADLMPQNYAITGDAILQLLENGELKLSLTEDFTTPRGPDVRIFLGNELSLNGASEIVDLTEINHFNGAATFDVPSGIEITDFNFVLFYCVQFQQFWASGELGDPGVPDQLDSCENSSVTLAQGAPMASICTSDEQADRLNFENSLGLKAGDQYIYLLTDTNEILLEAITKDSYDFEGTTDPILRVYGLHYQGALTLAIGRPRQETMASVCFSHSLSDSFVTIRTQECINDFECLPTAIATTDWAISTLICADDGIADRIELRNNLGVSPGEHYAYLITDTNEILQEVVFDSVYDFEGATDHTQRVYGLSFDGTLLPQVGASRKTTTATSCFTHSDDSLYLTIFKSGCDPFECVESLTATHDWIVHVEICGEDGSSNRVFIQNNVMMPAGDHYAFLLTDTNETLLEVVLDSLYDFSSIEAGVYRFYGISFAGDLQPVIGSHRLETSASNCHLHSGNTAFLTVQYETNCLISSSTEDLSAEVFIFPNPGQDQIQLQFPTNFTAKRIDLFNQMGQLAHSVDLDTINSNLSLGVAQLPRGNYILRGVGASGKVFLKKVQLL